jgi:hypothetical protein
MAMTYDPFKPKPTDPPRPKRQMEGLGDAIALVAQPIAKAIDSVAGTNLQNCGGCAQRKGWINAAVPFKPDKSAKDSI